MLDRAEISVVAGGANSRIQHIIPIDLKPLQEVRILVRGTFICNQQALETAKETKHARIEFNGYITSRIRNVSYSIHIDDIVNFKVFG